MNWLKNNWELKLLALVLAVFLWLVLYFSPPAPDIKHARQPAFRGFNFP
jgi:YbbR domain-containing protein